MYSSSIRAIQIDCTPDGTCDMNITYTNGRPLGPFSPTTRLAMERALPTCTMSMDIVNDVVKYFTIPPNTQSTVPYETTLPSSDPRGPLYGIGDYESPQTVGKYKWVRK